MNSRSTFRRLALVLFGLGLCSLPVGLPLLENHPLAQGEIASGAAAALSPTAIHPTAAEHCEASTSEQRETCVACLLQRRAGGGLSFEMPQVGVAQALRAAIASVVFTPAGEQLPRTGGRAPPAV